MIFIISIYFSSFLASILSSHMKKVVQVFFSRQPTGLTPDTYMSATSIPKIQDFINIRPFKSNNEEKKLGKLIHER